MVITWAQREVETTRCAARDQFPLGGLCTVAYPHPEAPPPRPVTAWGHRKRQVLKSSQPGIRAVKNARTFGAYPVPSYVLRKPSEHMISLKPLNSPERWVPRLSAPYEDGETDTLWSSNLPRSHGEQMMGPRFKAGGLSQSLSDPPRCSGTASSWLPTCGQATVLPLCLSFLMLQPCLARLLEPARRSFYNAHLMVP